MILLEVNWGWSEVLSVSGIGFLLVVLMLLLLVGVMKLFGMAFTYRREITPVKEVSLPEEEMAAITVALALYKSALHDKESEVITIQSIKRAYSPWSSKIHGLTQLPIRK